MGDGCLLLVTTGQFCVINGRLPVTSGIKAGQAYLFFELSYSLIIP